MSKLGGGGARAAVNCAAQVNCAAAARVFTWKNEKITSRGTSPEPMS